MANDKNDQVRAMYRDAKARGRDEVAIAIEAVAALLGNFDVKAGLTADSSSLDLSEMSNAQAYELFKSELDGSAEDERQRARQRREWEEREWFNREAYLSSGVLPRDHG